MPAEASDPAVALTLDRPQHQPGTGHQGMGQGARGSQASQLGLLVGSQGDGWLGAPSAHVRHAYPDQLLTLVIYGTQH